MGDGSVVQPVEVDDDQEASSIRVRRRWRASGLAGRTNFFVLLSSDLARKSSNVTLFRSLS
jgi:hypothetical protein